MNHNEATDFLAHYGKLGMKWGHRSANPKFGERGAMDRVILKQRAKYEAESPGANQGVKSARSAYRQNRTAANKQALRGAKAKRRTLDYETALRNVETGREIGQSLLITVGTYSAVALAAKALLK